MNPLLDVHKQAEAEFQNYGEIEIVSTFNEPQAEYAAIRKGSGMMDLPQRALIEATGKDRLTFLNSLLSNELVGRESKQPIDVGAVRYAFLLDAKSGKIKTDLNVINLSERVLLDLETRLVQPILDHLARFVFSEKVAFRSLIGEMHQIALHGPGSSEITLPAGCIDWPDDSCGTGGRRLIVPTSEARSVWMHLLTQYGQVESEGKRKLRPVGWAAFNTCRIEAGRPLFGIDFDDNSLPAETGQLARAVSFTKGCYPGQEIVARMDARKQVAKKVVGFRMEGPELPMAGSPVTDDQGNTVGGVTSSTISPVLSNAAIGLALVKRTHIEPGSKLSIPAEGSARTATVVELPFVK